MNLKDTARQVLAGIQLTTDDTKKFQQRGSFALQLKNSVGRVLFAFESFVKTIKSNSVDPLEYTVIKYLQEDDADNRADLVLAFDLQNIFHSDDKDTSLLALGKRTNGKNLTEFIPEAFKLDAIEPTGLFPFKYSVAAQKLGFSIDHDYEHSDWTALHAKYNSNAEMQVMRTDADNDISWLEIQHIFITPIS